MDPFKLSGIGNTGLKVTQFGLGGAALGNLYASVSDSEGRETIETAYQEGVRYFDTAPFYGLGRSEELFGQVLRQHERSEFVLSSKAGRLLVDGEIDPDEYMPFVDIPKKHPVFDFSRDAILRSLDESLERLGLDYIDIVYIHDPDDHYESALNQAFPALAELRSQGVIKAVGAGMNQAEMPTEFARHADFDCFLLAGRYTLLDQIALKELFPICEQKNISIIIGGPFNSGILATGPVEGAHYNYLEAPPEIMERTRRLQSVCERYQVSLKAAALQFPMFHPVVAANIPGTRLKSRFLENLKLFTEKIPMDFWAELKSLGLIDPESPTPSSD
jgi:D-threo-aldose 1-dehydrogenase